MMRSRDQTGVYMGSSPSEQRPSLKNGSPNLEEANPNGQSSKWSYKKDGLSNRCFYRYPVTNKAYLQEVSPMVDENHHQSNLFFKTSNESPNLPPQHLIPTPRAIELISSQVSKALQEEEEVNSLKFNHLKEKLIQKIRYHLKSSRTFSINELYKQIESREDFEVQLEQMKGLVNQLPNLDLIDRKAFLYLCTADKVTSKAIQTLIETGTEAQKKRILQFSVLSWSELLFDKYGNYILKQGVQSDKGFQDFVEAKMINTLPNLIPIEYSSRVMQMMVKTCPKLRLKSIEWLSENIHNLIENLPSVFLFASAVQCVEGPSELLPVRSLILSKRGRSIKHHKYFRRIMMSYAEKCILMDLDLLFDFFELQTDFWSLLDEKFGAHFLSAMVIRSHENTIAKMVDQLRWDLLRTLKAKYFKIFLFKLSQVKATAPIRKMILNTIGEHDPKRLKELVTQVEVAYFLVYVVLLALEPTQTKIIQEIFFQINNPHRIAGMLTSMNTHPEYYY